MLAATLLLALTTPAADAATTAAAWSDTRTVPITASFSGKELLLYGQTPPGTERVLALVEGPPSRPVRLMLKGRVGLFWMGVRQYEVAGLPGVYLLSLSYPLEDPGPDGQRDGLQPANAVLRTHGAMLGRPAVASRAHVEGLSGPLLEGERDKALDGFWKLQAEKGLYAVRPNAIRIDARGNFYHTVKLPADAPDGRYLVTTYFLSEDQLLGRIENRLFLRTTGMIAWLSRLAGTNGALYGMLTVAIALGAGWLAGALFKKGTGH